MSKIKTLLEGTQDDKFQAKSKRGFKPSPYDIVLADFFEYLLTIKSPPLRSKK
jgi:hypothetical protein